MPLRIVLDVRRIRDFGIGTYIRNLIQGLAKLDRTNHYTLIAAGLDYPELAGLPPNFELALFKRLDGRLITDLRFSWFIRRLPADVYHIPLNTVPVGMPDPYIVTVHDMGNLLFAAKTGLEDFQLSRARRGLLKAARIIAVSNATRREVESLLQIPPDRVRTIYNAPDPAFFGPASTAIACVGEESFTYSPTMQRTLDRYHIHYPFLLYAGRTNPQKNIPRLVEAFAVLRGEMAEHPLYRDLRLIIIGDEISKFPSLRHAVIQSRVEDAVRFLGFVPIETLRIFYQAAAVFVFPSLYEGFGLPPLEAMCCGAPVVASDVSALAEVVGDAAFLVNPENVFDIARGIREVLLDRDLRARLIQRGFEQVKRFSWDTAASQVLATYKEVASSRR